MQVINELDLKRGKPVSCGPTDKQFGETQFEISCDKDIQKDFNLAVAMLHSFEYDEAEKAFAKIIDKEPTCIMAYWGVAMSNYHPLWAPPSAAELKKGAKAIEIAQSLSDKSERENDYVAAIAAFYKGWEQTDHRTRSINFEKAMENLYIQYQNEKEPAIFYALALNAAADPSDKSFKKQKKAGTILNALYPGETNHPGIAHYIIHTYDSPELATMALPMARKYASIAPSSAHALHMPSHIFTRLGLWNECITSNIAAASSARCYAESAGIKGHWDEELHSMDYLVYAYLQKGDNRSAKQQWDYLKTITKIDPLNFKVAYAFASIPSRYLLENKAWEQAAALRPHMDDFPWQNYRWQEAILHFTRLLGSVHTGKIESAKSELAQMHMIYDTLVKQNDPYKANQVQIQIKSAEAWIAFKQGKHKESLELMQTAASMEDKTEKHPVTPGEVIPARELLGDLLMEMNKPLEALRAYEEDLAKHPNRFNGLYGAGLAAEKSGNSGKADFYYRQLLTIADPVRSDRPELSRIKLRLQAIAMN